jgi:glyoxylase-like metal-dependent hydrolase (beta-lactamase superfamily II)/rhodanese-related sulfurtransferase
MLDFTQYYLECLSHASYLIGDTSTGRAVVVDPQRDVSEYVADASAKGLTIERVIETHFHADFLSGHLELAAATGAVISYGDAARGKVEFPVEFLADGQRLSLGEVELEIRATPGHTPESISVVVYERAGDQVPYGVLTGDTLFIGDVGRPDLLSSVGITADELARQLYHSLHEQLLTLPDETKVYPAHGAGSACGKNLSTETVSTIGEQRRTNYALAPMSVDDFVEAVTQGQSVAPLYFPFAANLNRQARQVFDETAEVPMLSFDEVVAAQQAGAIVLDTRDSLTFAAGHLAGSVNVGIDGRYADYAGQVVRPGTPIVLVTEPGQEAEGRLRLGRIGFDQVLGALADPVRTLLEHPEATTRASRLTAAEMAERIESLDRVAIIDVRNPGETEAGMVPGAVNIPLAKLLDEAAHLDPDVPTIVYCAGGYRSSVGASTLRWLGFRDVSDLVGGFGAWSLAGQPTATPTPAG